MVARSMSSELTTIREESAVMTFRTVPVLVIPAPALTSADEENCAQGIAVVPSVPPSEVVDT